MRDIHPACTYMYVPNTYCTYRSIIELQIQLLAEAVLLEIKQQRSSHALDVQVRVAGELLACGEHVITVWPAMNDDSDDVLCEQVLRD